MKWALLIAAVLLSENQASSWVGTRMRKPSVPTVTCSLPWGGTITPGQSVTAYGSTNGTCGFVCSKSSQTRVCQANGTLTGYMTKQSCTDPGSCVRVGIQAQQWSVFTADQTMTLSFNTGGGTGGNDQCLWGGVCGGSGKTMTLSGNTSGNVNHYRDFTGFGTLPTVVSVTMSGNTGHTYPPTFAWLYNDGSTGTSISGFACNGISDYFGYFNQSFSCTMPAP